MMTNKKTRSSHLLKLLALVPIVGTALALNARTVTDYVYDEPQKKIIKKSKANAKINTGTVNEIVVVEQAPAVQQTKPVEMPNPAVVDTTSRVFDVVEQMPQFPGGPAELMKFLGQNVRYPEEAHKNNIQGRVIATFVVEKDGSISEASVAKSVDPLLDEEALRVVNSMPNWTPGRQNGEPVAVKYTIPISFRLQGESEPASESIKIGPHPNAKDVEVVIDGKVVDVTALNSINPDDIASMNVEKAKDGAPKDRIIITTKKK
jgi:TonB family protein